MAKTTAKKLGDLIELVDRRNKNIEELPLLGVSIKKEMIPSIANIIGTDMSSYKIVKKGEFAYGPVTSRNGDKISIALQRQYNEALVSQAYTTFRIKDDAGLDPEYLMLWFNRSEFDRYARFKSHGSAREIFSWDEMCDVQLPIPSIEQQHKIVDEFLSILNRINAINDENIKLDKLAYLLYLKYVANSEEEPLDIQCNTVLGGTPSRNNPNYWNGDIGWINSGAVNSFRILKPSEYVTDLALKKSATKVMPRGTTVIAITGATLGQYSRLCHDFCANQSVIGIVPKSGSVISNEFIYLAIRKKMPDLLSGQTGGAQPHINSNDVKSLMIPITSREVESKISKHILPMFNLIELNCRKIECLEKIKNSFTLLISNKE